MIPKNIEKKPNLSKKVLEEINQKLNKSKEKQNQQNKLVEDWKEFSMNPRTEEEIKERIMYDVKHGVNTCCISYICRYSKLSEELIDWICDNTYVRKGNTSKVDWDYVSLFQTLSEEFIEKHAKNVNWRYIYQKQNLSEEFRKKHIKDVEAQEEILIVADPSL